MDPFSATLTQQLKYGPKYFELPKVDLPLVWKYHFGTKCYILIDTSTSLTVTFITIDDLEHSDPDYIGQYISICIAKYWAPV